MTNAVRRYRDMIVWIEAELGLSGDDTLGAYFAGITNEDLSFVLRSGPIRKRADCLCSLLHAGKLESERSEVFSAYEKLSTPIRALRYETLTNDGHNSQSRWERAGFDLRKQLSDSFPYTVSAWIGTTSLPTCSRLWDEASEVAVLFPDAIMTAGAEKCAVRPFSEEQCERIEKAIEIVENVCSETAYDIVVNVRHICYMDYARWQLMEPDEYRNIAQSLSRSTMPSCIFLSCHAFTSQDDLVESIYHESLHRKLANLIQTRLILKESYDWQTSPRFVCSWNKHFSWGSNDWPFDRALDAFHVYVHLSVFYGAVIEKAIGELDGRRSAARRKISYDRACILGDWLYSAARECLGSEGMGLLETLQGALRKSCDGELVSSP
jgi:hypothetical protein